MMIFGQFVFCEVKIIEGQPARTVHKISSCSWRFVLMEVVMEGCEWIHSQTDCLHLNKMFTKLQSIGGGILQPSCEPPTRYASFKRVPSPFPALPSCKISLTLLLRLVTLFFEISRSCLQCQRFWALLGTLSLHWYYQTRCKLRWFCWEY